MDLLIVNNILFFIYLLTVHGWKHQVHRESVGHPFLAVQGEVTLGECRRLCESDDLANCDMFEFCPTSDVGVCRRMARGSTAPPDTVVSTSCDLFTAELISGTGEPLNDVIFLKETDYVLAEMVFRKPIL